MEHGGYFNTTFAGTTGPLKEAAVLVAFTPDTGVSAGLLETHARALRSKPAIHPLTKTDVKTFAVAKGQYNVNLDDIFQGRILDRVILGMTFQVPMPDTRRKML